MNLRLVKPNITLKYQHYEFLKELSDKNEKIIPAAIDLKDMDYNKWLGYNLSFESEDTCPKDLVCATTYFLVDKNERVLGAINIRYTLNDYLLKYGGHIGYGVRPCERKKGYAKTMLKLGLKKAKELGIKNVLVTCDKNNVGSAKTIMANGGVLENEVKEDERITQRYWIKVYENK